MKLRKACLEDSRELARLNHELMLSERYDGILPLEKLIPRMQEFLRTEYDAFWILSDDERVGYILIKHTSQPIYIRQMYIKPEHQRKGLGSQTVRMIMEHYHAHALDVEVMVWNEAGLAFWKKIGFKPRCYSMRLTD